MKLKDEDHELVEGSAWIDVKGFAIRIHSSDDGVTIAAFARKDLEDSIWADPIADITLNDWELT